MIVKKSIEDPRSLLLNQRSLCSVFLIFDKHNPPKKNRIKLSSVRLFQKKTPAIDFPPAKNLVSFLQNRIPEIVYQWPVNQSWMQLL